VGRPQKKSRIHADVAYAYNLNPFDLTQTQLLLLHAHIPRVQAVEELHHRSLQSQLTPERAYGIVLQATQDKEAAQSAHDQVLQSIALRVPRDQ